MHKVGFRWNLMVTNIVSYCQPCGPWSTILTGESDFIPVMNITWFCIFSKAMGWGEVDWEKKGKVIKGKRSAEFRRLTAYCQGTENPNIKSLDYFATHFYIQVEFKCRFQAILHGRSKQKIHFFFLCIKTL